MLIFENTICLALSLLILGMAFLAKFRIGTFYNPISIFNLFWFLYIFFPVLIVWDVSVSVVAVFYIFLFNLIFFLSIYFFSWKNYRIEKNESVYLKNSAYYFLLLISLIGTICLSIDIYIQGLGGLNFFEIGSMYSSRRYEEGLNLNIYSKIGNSLALICAIFGGVVVAYMNKKSKFLILLASFAPSLFMMLLQSAKGGFFLSFSLFLGAFFTERLRQGILSINILKIFGWKRVSLGVGLGVVAVLSSFLSRGGYDLSFNEKLKFLKYNVASYSSGHLYAFSDWFVYYYDLGVGFLKYSTNYEIPPGYYTFTSIFNVFGASYQLPIGIFDEFYDIPEVVTTNIYTLFRGVLLDFTFLGSLVFAIVMGFFANYIYRLFLRGGTIFSTLFLVYFFAFSYQSFGVSSLTWVTVPFSFFVMVVIYKIFLRKK